MKRAGGKFVSGRDLMGESSGKRDQHWPGMVGHWTAPPPPGKNSRILGILYAICDSLL